MGVAKREGTPPLGRRGASVKMGAMTFAAASLLFARSAVADPRAEPTDPTAKQHLATGRALYNTQKWDDAIREFEEGYRSDPAATDHPIWLYDLGQAHRFAGHYSKAAWYFDRFVSAVQGDPEATDVAATASALAKSMHEAEDREPKSVAPPVEIRETTPPADQPRWYDDRVGWIALGSGVLVSGIGAGFAFSASSLSDQADHETNVTARADLRDRASTRQTEAIVGLAIGGAVTIFAVIKLAIPPDAPAPRSAFRFQPGPGDVGVAFSFDF